MTESHVAARRPALKGWIVFVIVGVVAIAAGGITGRVLATSGAGTGPSDTVLRLYQAIRDNNARAALAELATPPSDTTYITDAVLAAGHTTGKISDISVPATSSTVVPVTYTLAGETVTDRISVQAVGSTYKVSTSLNGGGISLKGKIRTELPLSIAGTRVTTDTIVLLPGSYPMTTVTDRLAYGSGSLVVKRLSDMPTTTDLKVQLTDVGLSVAQAAVTSSLAACTAQKSFSPAGCPFKFTGTTADASTVTWTMLSRPADDLKVTVSATDVTRSTAEATLKLRITYTNGNAPVTQDLSATQAVATINLLADPMTITWQT